ncbi:MAG: NADH-quinone oxidoreductase subunit J [Saprospiraceae bacterium]|nr:NADH-quinone oxidoreductase subunit J [Saprospiraceae bacterium]
MLVVFHRNPVYNVLSLVVCFFAIAGHYFLLNSQFLAMVHIIVYAGAIMVLFLYVIMMLNLNFDTEPNKSLLSKIGAVIGGGTLMIVLIVALKSAEKLQLQSPIDNNLGLINNLGNVLYTQYMLPFEISSILFLAGMVGAVMLGKREIQ